MLQRLVKREENILLDIHQVIFDATQTPNDKEGPTTVFEE